LAVVAVVQELEPQFSLPLVRVVVVVINITHRILLQLGNIP
jgi:hypothetical protein